jgi:hypothetical protein
MNHQTEKRRGVQWDERLEGMGRRVGERGEWLYDPIESRQIENQNQNKKEGGTKHQQQHQHQQQQSL